MKNYGLFPVAQPQSYGTTVSQSSIYIPAPVNASSIKAGRPTQSIREFEYLARKHQKANFQPELEALISMPALVLRGLVGKEWTRFAREITNRAVFIQASEAGSVHIQDGNFYKEKLSVSLETAATICFFTKLYYVLGQLGKIDIPIELDGEYRKQSSVGGASGLNFVYALQGFLIRANIDMWHKQHINAWINGKLPEYDWLPMAELYHTMQVANSPLKHQSKNARACPEKVEQALAGGLQAHQLSELIGAKGLAFYDVTSKRSFAKPGQWASFYWAMLSMGYIQNIPAEKVPEMIAASFNGKTSKSSINAIFRKEVIREGYKPVANTETARICDAIKRYLADI